MRRHSKRFVLWVLPFFAATVALSGMSGEASAQNTARPRSKTVEGPLLQATTTALKLKSREGDLDITLTPDTQYHRMETGLQISDLKQGEIVQFTLKGTNGLPTVETVTPLTLKFSNSAQLTLPNDPKLRFDRISSSSASELAAGQTAKVANNLFPDGRLEAREVWLIIKPARKTASKD